MQKLFLDWESFYDRKAKYDLSDLSVVEYVRDSRFKAHGFAAAFDSGLAFWIDGEQAASALRVIDWKKTILVAHNAKFDAFILKERYGYTPASYICTRAMSKAVIGKRIKTHSLKNLAEHFGLEAKGIMKTEGLRDLTPKQSRELGEYSAHDVELCQEIFKRLEPEFPKSQYRPMSWTIKVFVEPKLVLDVPLLDKTAEEENKRRETIFKEIGISKKELASNKKFPKILADRGYTCPMKPSPKTGKMIPALAKGDTAFLDMCNTENEELKALCEARLAAKSTLLETRSASLAKIGVTGAWPFDVEFSGADQTHRYSGGGAAGGNPQNFTRGSNLRKSVKAPKACKLVVGDFSKVEPRLVANLSKDPALLKALEGDPYLDFASAYFGRAINKNDDKQAYKTGKEGIISLGYQAGHVKFRDRLKINLGISVSLEESKKTVEFYRYRYRRVKELWDLLGHSIPLMVNGKEGQFLDFPLDYAKERLILPSGLPLQYPNLRQEVGSKGYLQWVYDVYDKGQLVKRTLYGGKLLENICQALAGELTKTAIERLEDYTYGQLHDEAILVVPEDRAESIAEAMEIIMSESPSWLPTMKLGAEIHIGNNWLESK